MPTAKGGQPALSDLLNPSFYVGMTPNQLQQIGSIAHEKYLYSGNYSKIQAAMQKGNPEAVSAASQNKGGAFGSFTDIRDLVEGAAVPVGIAAASFVNPLLGAAAGKVLPSLASKGAQASLDPGLNAVAGIAGGGAGAGAKAASAAAQGGATAGGGAAGTDYSGLAKLGKMGAGMAQSYMTPSGGGNTKGVGMDSTIGGGGQQGLPSGGMAGNPLSQLFGAVQTGQQAGQTQQTTQQAASAADPFASQRPQYQKMLSQLLSDPSFYSKTPAYQAQMQSGTEAINRSAGAKGMLGSGNRLAALEEYGQGVAQQGMTQYASMLGSFAGANTGSPAQAGSLMAQGTQQAQGQQTLGLSQELSAAGGLLQQAGGISGVSGAIGQAGTALSNWWDSSTLSTGEQIGPGYGF